MLGQLDGNLGVLELFRQPVYELGFVNLLLVRGRVLFSHAMIDLSISANEAVRRAVTVQKLWSGLAL